MAKPVKVSKLHIPIEELEISFAKSSGPGGQNVNKTNTKVQLSWQLMHSPALTDSKRELLLKNLQSKLTVDGRLVIVSDRFRSQDRNREDCLLKFAAIIEKATFIPKARKKTKPTKASKEKRLKDKKSRSEIKKNRKIDF